MRARQALVQALEMAQPEGFMRTFLKHGETLQLLILECRPLIEISSQDGLLAFTDSLLEAYEKGASGDRPPTGYQKSMAVSASRQPCRALSEGGARPEIARCGSST
jgi:hypothetical protein